MPIADLAKTLETDQSGVNYYNAKQFLAQFGAKDKVASYKKPTADAQSACYIDNKSDIMCGAYWQDRATNIVYYITLDSAEISDVSKKELGWYDADGDKILEVNDKCPFDKNNSC
jgi:hypothetical protein